MQSKVKQSKREELRSEKTMKQPAMKSQMSAFQLKGSLLTLTVLELLKTDMPAISSQFLSLVQRTPDLFRRMPVIIDLSKLPEKDTNGFQPLDFHQLKETLLSHGLVPVGVRGGTAEQEKLAGEAGFALLNPARVEQAIEASEQVSKAKSNTKASRVSPHHSSELSEKTEKMAKTTARIITQPVRSGQQIYAKETDLIILASVSPGAEILACGNIHVYGTLHGRAMAGVTGNKEARIFCRKLKAELVSIAGNYWVNEDLTAAPKLEKDQVLQIYLDNDRLQIGII